MEPFSRDHLNVASCAVPGAAFVQLDRRLTTGESAELALREVRDAVKRAGVDAKVELLKYSEKAYTGTTYQTDKYFPTWVEDEDAPHQFGRTVRGISLAADGRRVKPERPG